MLSNEELMSVKGGSLTSQFLNAVTRAVETVLDLGRTVGSSIRRIFSGKLC